MFSTRRSTGYFVSLWGQYSIHTVGKCEGTLTRPHFSPPAVQLPPAVVSVGPVGFSHLVQLKLLLDNITLLRGRCQQLLREFLVHVCPSVFVLSALCDHPLHSEEATSVLRKRDGHLSGSEVQIYALIKTQSAINEADSNRFPTW